MAFSYHDTGVIERELWEAGFGSIEIETLELKSEAASLRDHVCQDTVVASAIEEQRPGGLAGVTDAVAAWLAARLGNGPISGTMRAHVIAASG